MLSSAIIHLALVALSPVEVKELIDKVPKDWYTSTTRLFEYCVDVKFQHPICPRIQDEPGSINYEQDFFASPMGALNAQTLFQAKLLYQIGRPADYWMITLGLDRPAPKGMDPRLWAEAQWLWAQILFDQKKYKEAAQIFDQIVDEFRGRALFHQQRAWAQFFAGQYDRALGSVLAAESPIIYKVPFFEKFFLRALVEKETCRPLEALQTISSGRSTLNYAKSTADSHPWVILCARRSLGETCTKLRSWFDQAFNAKIKKALEDLDLLEIELRDENSNAQARDAKSEIVWPSVNGEWWQDELGYYSVTIKSKC